MIPVGHIFLGSLAAMMKIFILGLIGVLVAIYPKADPLLPTSALRNISRLSGFLLVPGMITYSIGSTVNPVLIGKYGKLIPFSLLTSGISYVLCLVFKPLHQSDQELFWTSLVCMMSPNAISMPIMVLESLCDLSIVNEDYGGVTKDCFAEGTSFTFVYSIGWNILYWSTLYPLLTKVSENIKNGGRQSVVVLTNEDAANHRHPSVFDRYLPQWAYWSKIKGLLSRSLLTPSMYAIYAGLFIALITPLQNALFGSDVTFLTPFGGSLKTLAQPVVCLNTIVMSASLVRVRLPDKWRNIFIKSEAFVFGLSARIQNFFSSLTESKEKSIDDEVEIEMTTASAAPKTRNRVLSQFRHHSRSMRRLFGSMTGRHRSATLMEMDPFCAVPDYPQPDTDTTDYSPSHTLHEPEYEVEAGTADAADDSHTNEVVVHVDAAELKEGDPESSTLSPMWGNGTQERIIGTDKPENKVKRKESAGQIQPNLKKIDPPPSAQGEANQSTESSSNKTVTLNTFLFHLLSRMIIPPAVMLVVVRLCVAANIIAPEDRLFQIFLVVEAAAPAAQLVMVSLNQLGIVDIAAQISLIYCGCYLASIATLTIWATIGIATIYST